MKDIVYNKEARNKILEGVRILARTVSVTMGPKGRNVIIGPPKLGDGPPVGAPTITKDGVTVARAVVLGDPCMEMGCQLVKEVAGRTAEIAGDGTTTATVLTEEIYSRGLELIDSGYSPLYLRDGLNLALELVLKEIDELSRSIDTKEDLVNVSTISANNDPDLGGVIAEAFELVDREGLVMAEAKPGVKNSVRLIDGVELKSGYINEHFLDSGQSMSALENCRVLLLDREMSHIEDAKNLFNQIAQNNESLLVIAKDVNKIALKTLVENHRTGFLKNCAIKIPNFGAYQDRWFEDLSIVLGTKIMGEERGLPLKDLEVSDLGFAKKVEVSKYGTRIVSPERDEERTSFQIAQYEEDLEKLIGESERVDIRKRKGFLTNKASVITIGYNTELELREKDDRLIDATSAVRAAIDEGIVPGGGMALFNAASKINIDSVEEKYRPAVELLVSACVRPAIQIISNTGADPAAILERIIKEGGNSFGYNSADDSFGDLFDMGVVDPKKVTRTALQNALSVALLLLTTEAIIVESLEDPSGWQPPAGWRLPSKDGLNHKY